jgi:DNA-binding response OmpR family regulator
MKTPIIPSPPLSAELLKLTLPSPVSLSPSDCLSPRLDATPKTRILVAEDDAISRGFICARLAKWGYEVVATQNGTEAMTALRSQDAPSLAILDWMMPGMDGLEICRRVREVNRRVYLILLTARGSKENVVEGLRAGADDYLTKPFDSDELQARILVGLRMMALQAAPSEPPRVGFYPPPKTRILVAEDDAVLRQLICSRLAKWHYEPIPTVNGTEAMTALRKRDAPALAILDWLMPDMDGLEICHRLREAKRSVYIILLTARGSKENIIEGLRAGADDYLVKPFHAEELHARILVGLRVMSVQAALAARLTELEAAAEEISKRNRQFVI